MSRLLAGVVTLLSAAALVVAVPGTASAAGTYRDDDGSRESSVHVDASDGHDDVSTAILLPVGSVHGADAATFWVYGQADGCALAGQGHRLTVNWDTVIDFDPCTTFPSGSYGWHGFPVPLTALGESNNSFAIDDADRDPLVYADVTRTGHNASYGVDTDNTTVYSKYQRDASGTHLVPGVLMWYLQLTGSHAAIHAYPYPRVWFGVVDVGTPSPVLSVSVSNIGLEDLVSTVTLSGANAADVAVTADGCGGRRVAPRGSCTFGLVLTPSAPGARYVTVTISAPGAAPYSIDLYGEGRTGPPTTTITTADGAVVVSGTGVTGTVTGLTATAYEWVTFVPELPGAPTVASRATLSCNASRTSCTWAAGELVLPGRYRVTAYGVDVQGNRETPGPGVSVTVV